MIRDEIDRRNREFEQAFNRGDMASLAGLYVDDAQLLPPGNPPMTGRSAITQFWQGARASGIHAVTLNTGAVEAQGDLAYEVSEAVLTIDAEQGRVTAAAKYVVVWKRQRDGCWRMAVDIWNSNE